ncbi:MAG: methyltransferase domain-containing protein [Methylobacteriaceae bacterium]|nr:methyltransferase domain-containing protein [Methylobacteriaceae bacterium]
MNWREFWDGEHAIYVNARHKTLHYERIARDIVALLPKGGVALDHGAGEALSADAVAAACSRLYLYDAAPSVQQKLAARFSDDARIGVLDDAGLAGLADESLDAVVVNSLLQYLTREEFVALLDFWRGKLKPGGKLILGDVIPPDVGPLDDVKALMTFALQGGFLFAAAAGLARTFFSDYRKLRAENPLTTYAGEAMARLLDAHGFSGAREARNIGHNQARMTFLARRR